MIDRTHARGNSFLNEKVNGLRNVSFDYKTKKNHVML